MGQKPAKVLLTMSLYSPVVTGARYRSWGDTLLFSILWGSSRQLFPHNDSLLGGGTELRTLHHRAFLTLTCFKLGPLAGKPLVGAGTEL